MEARAFHPKSIALHFDPDPDPHFTSEWKIGLTSQLRDRTGTLALLKDMDCLPLVALLELLCCFLPYNPATEQPLAVVLGGVYGA